MRKYFHAFAAPRVRERLYGGRAKCYNAVL